MADSKAPLFDVGNYVLIFRSSGIGYETIKAFALRKAKIFLAGRSEKRVKEAIDSLIKDYPQINKPQLEWLPLDLADLDSVQKAVAELKSWVNKVDILSESCFDLMQYQRKLNLSL